MPNICEYQQIMLVNQSLKILQFASLPSGHIVF